MNRTKLSDGIYLNIINSDKFKTDYFDMCLVFPLKEETASLAALLPMVLKRGSKTLPNMAEISKRLDFLYSTGFATRNIKRGEAQIISFGCDFLRESLVPEGTELMNEVFSTFGELVLEPYLENGVFSADYVESEKKNLCDAIRALVNNKNVYAMKKCHEAMCEGSDFAVNEGGSVENVEKITPDGLYKFYKDLLASARIEMFYTGMADADTIEALCHKLISGIARTKTVSTSTEKFIHKRDKVLEIVEEMDVAQGKLILGFSSSHTIYDKDYTAYSLFNELFGGSPTSKLFENVREKLSLCYYCRSMPEAHKGILTVASGIEVENRDKAVAEILAQLENTRSGNISDEELDSAKKSLTNSYRELYDDGNSLHFWYLSRLIADNEKTVEDIIKEISLVTKEDVARCARSTELDTIFFLKGTL